MTTLYSQTDMSENKKVPVLKKESNVTTTLGFTTYFHEFLDRMEKRMREHASSSQTTVRVSDILSAVAYFYERIRNVLEYRGEHVLRRNAIERILKRLLWEHAGHDMERVANVLLRELIWARYIPNDTLPRSKSKEVAQVINKYLYLLGALREKGTSLADSTLKSWVWGVASCEIEEVIDLSRREPYVRLMYAWFQDHFEWQDEELPREEKDIQLYLAIHRSLAKSDEPIMRYHLLFRSHPYWSEHSKGVIDEVVGHFHQIYETIEKQITYPQRLTLYRYVKKHAAPFEILKEIVLREGAKTAELVENTDSFIEKVREICAVKYAQIQRRVNRGIVRSIIYIFATKVILALLIEVPYELYRFGHLTWIPIGINVIFPPAMMWLIGLTIKAPGEANTQRIISKLRSIVYKNDVISPTPFSILRSTQGASLKNVFAVIYIALFMLVFGGVAYILTLLDFTALGIGIFFIFLSLVLLFGFRVRFTASELKVMGEREGLLSYVFENLTMPFLSTGVYLSRGLAKLNFLTLVLDFLIEAPLKTIIEMIEEWTVFIREKREEVVEVPEP